MDFVVMKEERGEAAATLGNDSASFMHELV
jgi:hypothetical protein